MSEKIKTTVIGAAGRMGRQIIKEISSSEISSYFEFSGLSMFKNKFFPNSKNLNICSTCKVLKV